MNWIYTRIASEIALSCVFCTIHSVAPKISNLKEGNSGKKNKERWRNCKRESRFNRKLQMYKGFVEKEASTQT